MGQHRRVTTGMYQLLAKKSRNRHPPEMTSEPCNIKAQGALRQVCGTVVNGFLGHHGGAAKLETAATKSNATPCYPLRSWIFYAKGVSGDSERRLVRKNVEGGRREGRRTHSYECAYGLVPGVPGSLVDAWRMLRREANFFLSSSSGRTEVSTLLMSNFFSPRSGGLPRQAAAV